MVYPYKYPLRATISGLLLGCGIWLFCTAIFSQDALRLATVYTGRASALLFLPVFFARPVQQVFARPAFQKLLRNRPGFGLMLAGNHHIHMVLLTIYLVGEGEPAASFYLNPGLYIYGLLIAMNVTSFPKMRNYVSGTTINIIHFVGLYALAGAFFKTLSLDWLIKGENEMFYITFTILFFAGLGLRIFAFLKNRNMRPKT